jgi:hypothetical protein
MFPWQTVNDYTYGVWCDENSPYFITYPNPASGIFTVDLEQTTGSAPPQAATVSVGKQRQPEKSYDLRLYDGQGALLWQQKAKGGTVQFNVANLPDGIYYLHIYDGVNEKPEMRQIVVEH